MTTEQHTLALFSFPSRCRTRLPIRFTQAPPPMPFRFVPPTTVSASHLVLVLSHSRWCCAECSQTWGSSTWRGSMMGVSVLGLPYKMPQTWGSEQQICIFSQSWRLDVQDQGVGRLVSPEASLLGM